MHVWIDGQCLQTASAKRGIGRYVSGLIRALAEHAPRLRLSISFNAQMGEQAIVARERIGRWIAPDRIFVWEGAADAGEMFGGYGEARRLSEAVLAHHVACIGPDIAISASPCEGAHEPAVPLLSRFGHRFALAAIFYDAIPLRFPQHYCASQGEQSFYARRLELYRAADAVLAISEFAAQELRHFVPESKVTAIGGAVASGFRDLLARIPAGPEDIRRVIAKPYLLYVGGFDWRKNVSVLPLAVALLPQPLRSGLALVIVGDDVSAARVELGNLWTNSGLDPADLHFFEAVSDQQLIDLYRGAEALVQPSFMEGLGFTPMEALLCGTPVIAARAGALPEIVNDERALFDPNSASDLMERLRTLVTDKALAAQVLARGQAALRSLSWQRTAAAAEAALAGALASTSRAEGASCRTGRSARHSEKAIAEARAQTAAALRECTAIERAAHLLAAAEPPRRTRPLWLMDVTATCRSDANTGIQRVVRHIATELARAQETSPAPATSLMCMYRTGTLHPVMAAQGGLHFDRRLAAEHLTMQPGDTLIMLDSSWEYFKTEAELFRRARLLGNEIVSVLYDLVPVRAPAFCHPGMPPVFAKWLATALEHSTAFVCISKAVADELLRLLQAIRLPRPMKVGYWPLGADFVAAPQTTAETGIRAEGPLFLMVGTIEPRKGHSVALEAFERLWREGGEATLCIAGRSGWEVAHLTERLRYHEEFGRRLFWIDGPSDPQLYGLYAACDALISSSYMEGYGLPIVEAARFGKPIIASDIPVFRELGERLGNTRFFELGSASSLAEAVRSFMAERAQDVGPGVGCAPYLSWAESATHFRDLILGQHWYARYEPDRGDGEPTSPLGQVAMRRPLDGEERRHTLQLVEGPYPSDSGQSYKVILRVVNRSGLVWSSAGTEGRELGIYLGCRLCGTEKMMLSPIPFVLWPGDEAYLSVEIDAAWSEAVMPRVAIELMQYGIDWWGGAVEIALPTG